MKRDYPDEFQEAIDFDEHNRHNPLAERDGNTADQLYLWRGCEPLKNVDLKKAAKRERKGKQIPLMVCNESECWT